MTINIAPLTINRSQMQNSLFFNIFMHLSTFLSISFLTLSSIQLWQYQSVCVCVQYRKHCHCSFVAQFVASLSLSGSPSSAVVVVARWCYPCLSCSAQLCCFCLSLTPLCKLCKISINFGFSYSALSLSLSFLVLSCPVLMVATFQFIFPPPLPQLLLLLLSALFLFFFFFFFLLLVELSESGLLWLIMFVSLREFAFVRVEK